MQPSPTWLLGPPIAAHCSPILWRFLSRGNTSKVLPLQPKCYVILPRSEQNTPTLLQQFTPIDKLPPLLQQNGRILGPTFDPGFE